VAWSDGGIEAKLRIGRGFARVALSMLELWYGDGESEREREREREREVDI
jgi:hypothetical protein